MVKFIFIPILLILNSCDCSTNVINKINGQEDESIACHEESREYNTKWKKLEQNFPKFGKAFLKFLEKKIAKYS